MTDLNELLKHTSRSLYLSARCLPGAVRGAFSAAYLLCRYADSIADTALLRPERRLQWVQKFPALVARPDAQAEEEIRREISGSSSNIYEEKLLENLPACINAFEKLPPRQRSFILDVVHEVCRGMETDLDVFPPENAGRVSAFSSAQELEEYCHLMGGAPGVFWSKLIADGTKIKAQKEHFFNWGRDIGDALQIVNILRDFPRDLRIGRCYFPLEDLHAYGLKEQDLLDAVNSARFEPIKQKWIAWGRAKLRSAKTYFAALPKTQPRHRAAVAWPVLWAADTLNKLSREKDLLNPAVRVKIARRRIYLTMLVTPPVLLSDALFNSWLDSKLSSQ